MGPAALAFLLAYRWPQCLSSSATGFSVLLVLLQPRVDFDGPCLGLAPLLLDLDPDVRSRSPWPLHFCPEEDLAAR